MFTRLLAGAVSIAAMTLPRAEPLRMRSRPDAADFRRAPRIRTGKTYPHSSGRQRARYARQLAAGRLAIVRVPQ